MLKATLETIAFCVTVYITYPLVVDSGYYPDGRFAHFIYVLGVYGIFYTFGKGGDLPRTQQKKTSPIKQ